MQMSARSVDVCGAGVLGLDDLEPTVEVHQPQQVRHQLGGRDDLHVATAGVGTVPEPDR